VGTDDSDIACDFKEEERGPERVIRGRAERGHRRPVPPGKVASRHLSSSVEGKQKSRPSTKASGGEAAFADFLGAL
jgi:hypothetical protein